MMNETVAAKDSDGDKLEATASHLHDVEGDGPATNNALMEHEPSLREIFKKHKAVVWWCFYWAMAAVGW